MKLHNCTPSERKAINSKDIAKMTEAIESRDRKEQYIIQKKTELSNELKNTDDEELKGFIRTMTTYIEKMRTDNVAARRVLKGYRTKAENELKSED